MIVKLTEKNIHYTDQLIHVRDLKVDHEKVKKFIQDEKNILLMEVIDEVVVGLVWGYVLERIDSEPMMFIYSVDVVQEFRKKGIASKLVKAFIDSANNQGFRNSFLITDKDNIPANKLYRSLNGKEMDDKVLYMFFKEDEINEKN